MSERLTLKDLPALKAGAYLLTGGWLWSRSGFELRNLLIKNKKITAVTLPGFNPENLPEVDVSGSYLLPGFLDVHTHGAVGVDVNAADAEGLRKIGRFFASQGVTGWLCSILTDTREQTLSCIRSAREVIEGGFYQGAPLLGIHLEGPCLACAYKGAMPENLLMTKPDLGFFEECQKAAGGHIKYITIAPEIAGVEALIPKLTALGMTVAMGHSGAGYDQAAAAVKAGVASATHLGNACRLFHQHDPAIWGVALESDIYVEAICDGRHLHPGSVRLYLKAKGWDKVVAVTDSIMAAGLPDGNYKLGVNDVVVKEGDAKLKDGTRAGSTLTLAQALRNLFKFTGRPLEKVVPLVSTNAANLMGWPDKGSLGAGSAADITVMDDQLQVKGTLAGGQVIYLAGRG